MHISLFCLFLLVNFQQLGAAEIQDECEISPCKHGGPPIRFPFWLKGHQPQHCGYPGFGLSCTERNQTLMELPSGVKLLVKHINYREQAIHFLDPQGCLPRQLPHLNLSASPFRFDVPRPDDPNGFINYTLFNCSSEGYNDPSDDYYDFVRIHCLSIRGYRVVAVGDNGLLGYFILTCSRISNTYSIPWEQARYMDRNESNDLQLHLSWLQPRCPQCEAQRQRCRLKTNNSGGGQGTECFGSIKQDTGERRKRTIIGIAFASLFLASIIIGLCYLLHVYRTEKECQRKLESFLEDYRSQKPSRYSYADIKRITGQFVENLGGGGYGTVFKGRLSNDVLVAVKVLNDFRGNGEDFINEVSSMCRIHHINVARLVGFCADGCHRALIYEYLPNESLEKFILAPKRDNNRLLSWDRLYNIALGVAKGIEYLHQGCEQRILHFDIKPHNILLDQNFNPKISDFGLAKLCPKDQSAVSMTAARGTMGYIAPEVVSRNFGNVSYKSDVYSYGMLLLEMVGGRSNIDVTVERRSQVYFPEWVYNRFDKGEDLGIRVEDEEHAKIAKKLTIIGLWCIQWYPKDRPPMKVVVQMLEGETSSLTMPPDPSRLINFMESAYQFKVDRKVFVFPRIFIHKRLPSISWLVFISTREHFLFWSTSTTLQCLKISSTEVSQVSQLISVIFKLTFSTRLISISCQVQLLVVPQFSEKVVIKVNPLIGAGVNTFDGQPTWAKCHCCC